MKPWESEMWSYGDEFSAPAPMTCVASETRNVALLMHREDAALIAAAPDLYRALVDVMLDAELLAHGIQGTGDQSAERERFCATRFFGACDRAHAALRKARGES